MSSSPLLYSTPAATTWKLSRRRAEALDGDINGNPIQPPQILRDRLSDVHPVLLAISSLSRNHRRFIIDGLQEFGLPVLQVPSVEEITSGRTRTDVLRPVSIEEPLGRAAAPPDPELLGLASPATWCW